MNSIINCNNVNYSYNDGKHKTTILKNLNLVVGSSESIAILGQSGCGKSTLLNLLGGIDKPNSGEILIAGNNLNNLNEAKITKIRGKYLGFVYQFHHLLKDFNALENVAMPLLINGVKKHLAYEKAKELLADIGLEKRIQHLPNELSGGERQRVAIARALINNPACLLADEPTGNLDVKNAMATIDLMLELNNKYNSAVIIVTHDVNIANKMQRTLIMQDGQLQDN